MRALFHERSLAKTLLFLLFLALAISASACEYHPVQVNKPYRSGNLPPLDVRIATTGLDGIGDLSTARSQVMNSTHSALEGLLGDTTYFQVVNVGNRAPAYPSARQTLSKTPPSKSTPKTKKRGWRLFGSSSTDDANDSNEPPATTSTAHPPATVTSSPAPAVAQQFPYRVRAHIEYLELQAGKQTFRFESVETGRKPHRNFPDPFAGVNERFTRVVCRTTLYIEELDSNTGLTRTIASARGKGSWDAPWFFKADSSVGSNTMLVFRTIEEALGDALDKLLDYPKLAALEAEMRSYRHQRMQQALVNP